MRAIPVFLGGICAMETSPSYGEDQPVATQEQRKFQEFAFRVWKQRQIAKAVRTLDHKLGACFQSELQG